jgi:hypothetical protein
MKAGRRPQVGLSGGSLEESSTSVFTLSLLHQMLPRLSVAFLLSRRVETCKRGLLEQWMIGVFVSLFLFKCKQPESLTFPLSYHNTEPKPRSRQE